MSRPPVAKAHAPQRKRGHLRFAAILDVAAALFAEKGYDAVTMSEIAARSETAFASLYRFFPSKEALAITLLQHYAQSALDGLARLGGEKPALSPEALADKLVDYMMALSEDRRSAIAVIEAWGVRNEELVQFKERQRDGLASLLRGTFPNLALGKSRVMAFALLEVLKGVATAARKTPEVRRPLMAEYRKIVRAYLCSID